MKRTLILSAVLALMTSVSLYAGEGKGKPPGGPGHHGDMGLLPPKLREDLALTADQQAQAKELETQFDKARADLKAAHPEAEADMAKLREQMKAAHEAGDKEKMKQLGGEMHAKMQPLMDLRHQYMDKLRALLTPEQQKKLDDAREEFSKHHSKPGKN